MNKEVLDACWNWADKLMWSIALMFTMGVVGRALMAKKELDWRELAGEMILATLCSIGMYAMGLMQGMTEVQMILFGSLGSMGGVRTAQWLIRIGAKSRTALNDE